MPIAIALPASRSAADIMAAADIAIIDEIAANIAALMKFACGPEGAVIAAPFAVPSVAPPNRPVETSQICLSLLAATGLRVSELCSLLVRQVRTDTGEIVVFGKGARERIVFVANAGIRKALARHIRSLRDNGDAGAVLFRTPI